MLYTNIIDHPFYKRVGDNIYIDLDIDIFEAALGAKVTVPTPYGPVNINIPAGTQPGQKLRIKNKGVPHLKGTGCGDLFININVKVPQIAYEADRKYLKEMMQRYNLVNRNDLLEKGRL